MTASITWACMHFELVAVSDIIDTIHTGRGEGEGNREEFYYDKVKNWLFLTSRTLERGCHLF